MKRTKNDIINSNKKIKTTISNNKENEKNFDSSQLIKLRKDTEIFLDKIENLTELDPEKYMEVKELNPDEVRSKIEEITLKIVDDIMNRGDCELSIPSRNNKNQLYIKDIDRLVLGSQRTIKKFLNTQTVRKVTITTRVMELIYEVLCKGIHITKRDLYYTDCKLFGDQNESDVVLEDIACMCGCTRTSLNVVASEKGVVIGNITFLEDGDLIDCSKMGIGGKAIPPTPEKITNIQSTAEFILLIEKDAAFMRLAEDRFYTKYPCIIITAKGQPDVATRLFLRLIRRTLKLPVLGLFDSDPYGLKILSVYMSGSKNLSYDSGNLTTPDIKWLGVRPSDLNKYKIPSNCRLKMTDHDIKTGKELLQEDFIKQNPKWYKELELMITSGEKAEIRIL